MPAGALQVVQVVLGGEAAVDHGDHPSQAPVPHAVLDLGQDRLVVGVARPAPAAHRDPLPGDREPDHDLWQVGPVVLGVSVLAEGVLAVFFGVTFEVGAGGVEQQQIHLEVQQIGDGEEHRLLHPCLGVGLDQQVHRPVGLVLVHRLQPRDMHVARRPLGRGQLGERLQRPVADQREQHPLDIGLMPPPAQRPRDRVGDPQPPPQRVEHEHAAERPRLHHLELLARRLSHVPRLAVGVAHDRARQPPQPVEVELVLAAQVEQHLRPRHAADAAVVRQLHVADRRTVLAPPLRPP